MNLSTDLGFSARTVNALRRGQGYLDNTVSPVETTDHLAGLGLREALGLRGFGKWCLNDAVEVLERHGYSPSNSRLLKELDDLVQGVEV